MRTVQMTLKPELVAAVDALAAELKTSRSAFTRDPLRAALKRSGIKRREQQQQDGYTKFPVQTGEFLTLDDGELSDAEAWSSALVQLPDSRPSPSRAACSAGLDHQSPWRSDRGADHLHHSRHFKRGLPE